MLSLAISPYVDFENDKQAQVKIYTNDTLVYTSPAINRTTNIVQTGDIDIKNAEYITITIEGDWKGCIMLSDAVLK